LANLLFEDRINEILDTLRLENDLENTKITFCTFDEHHFDKHQTTDIDDIELRDDRINWIYITGLSDTDNFIKMKEKFKIHPLIIEDMLDVEQRTKLEAYDDYLFVVTDTVDYDMFNSVKELSFNQVSFVLKENLLVTVEQNKTTSFDRVLDKLEKIPVFRPKTTDGLLLLLMDAFIDNYYQIFDILGEYIDDLEDVMMTNHDDDILRELYTMKKNLIFLRKTLWPLRSVINEISKFRVNLVSHNTSIYMRDLYDHIIQMLEFIEVYRDMINSMIDAFDTNISNRTNEVMMVLTVWSTIFLPLTFLTGVYGMNFKYMPELQGKYGYILFWVTAVVITSVMIYYFKKKKWM